MPRISDDLTCLEVSFLPPANEVWDKVIFVHLSVSYSVHRGSGCCDVTSCYGQHHHPQQYPLPGQHPPLPGQHPLPPPFIKWAVRIQLECFLVFKKNQTFYATLKHPQHLLIEASSVLSQIIKIL